MTNTMIVEHRSEGDKYTMYTALDLTEMKTYFFSEYLKTYNGYIAESYRTWCENYAKLHGNISDDERSKIVWYLGHLKDRINETLEEDGFSARMEENAKINFNGIWDTIYTIE